MTSLTDGRQPPENEMIPKMTVDGAEENDNYKPAPVGSFVRGDSRVSTGGGGLGSRLSMAIRRSLRLAPRSSGLRTSAESPTVGVNKVDDIGKSARKFETFTEHADVAKQPCDRPLATMDEVENLIRLNRKTQPFAVSAQERTNKNLVPFDCLVAILSISSSRAKLRAARSPASRMPWIDRPTTLEPPASARCGGVDDMFRYSQTPQMDHNNANEIGPELAGKQSAVTGIMGATTSKSYDVRLSGTRTWSLDSGYVDEDRLAAGCSLTGYVGIGSSVESLDKQDIEDVDSLPSTVFLKSNNLDEVPDLHTVITVLRDISLDQLRSAERSKLVALLKKIVRNNSWPPSHQIRGNLWKLLSMDKNFGTNAIIYSRELENMLNSGVKTLSPSFISAEGTVIHDYGLKEQGSVTLQRLLIVIECGRPALKVVPILYPLCALFLHYMSPEDSYAAMIRLLDSGQKQRFLLQTELASIASSRTLLALLKKHKKSVYTVLKRRTGAPDDETLAKVFSNWQGWLFQKLPFDFIVRIMDCFLVEGHKLLLRVALALTYVWYKAKGKDGLSSRREYQGMSTDERINEIERQIAGMAENCPVSVQTLLDVGCSIRNLKTSTVERLQKDYESELQEYVTKLQNERPAQRSQHLYSVAFSSKILNTDAASELMASLPDRLQLEMPVLLYRLSEHGASFTKMWSLIDEAEQTLFVIRSTKGDIFGAYCSSCWAERRDRHERSRSRFFGTGESFVWKLNTLCGLPMTYGWSGRHSGDPNAPQMFQTATETNMIIGSGGGDAIHITGELTSGLSYPCKTYDSPALVDSNGFDIDEMEVFQVLSGALS
ncbi:hypothetical protein L596_014559 [Steinernema carpocapsae]|uniref:TLDc domain-containing protein n=1 Tax=Steinernema carpocapsae TaxID=34508 RepID=A0A4U5ND19_STECR|nr:hypothetical protein L596_014559 [Steinernema carpocapsae]